MLHLDPIAALAFVPLFSFCDREIGNGEKGAVKRSAAMSIAIVVGGILGVLKLGPWFGLTGVLWAAWRSIGFADGELDPSTPKGIAGCAFRYLLWCAFPMLAYWQGGDVVLLAKLMLVAAMISLALRLRFGQMTKRARAVPFVTLHGDFNATIEKLTGALFGAALAAYAILPTLHHS